MASLDRFDPDPDPSDRAGHVYRCVWWSLAIAVVGAGSVVSLLRVPWWFLLVVVAIFCAVTALVADAVEDALAEQLPFSRVTLMTVIVAPAAIAFPGWLLLVGPWALPLPMLVGLSHPLAVRHLVRLSRRLGGLTSARTPQDDVPLPVIRVPARPLPRPTGQPAAPRPRRSGAPLPSTELGDLTEHDLCHAWRRSFLVLQDLTSCRDLPGQSRVVGVRQGYLDEMERRNPAGFSRWLAAGARPASDPSRYLSTTNR